MTAPGDLVRDALTAVRLAAAGRCRCRKCNVELGLQDAFTAWFGGALAFAICLPCISTGNQVVVRRVPNGLEVAISRETAPLVLVPGSGPRLDASDTPQRATPVRIEHDPDAPLVLGGRS